MGIAQRLYGASLGLALALLGAGAFTWFSLGHVADLVQRTEAVRVVQLKRVSAIELEVTRVLLLLRHSMLARNAQELERAVAGIREKRGQVYQTLKAYEGSLVDAAEQGSFTSIVRLMDTFFAVAEQDLTLIEQGRKDDAFAFLVDKTVPARTELLNALRDAVKSQGEALRSELEVAADEIHTTLLILGGLVMAAIAGLALLSWHVAKVLKRRIQASCVVAEQVSRGELTAHIVDRERDEFSLLLAALASMQHALVKVVSEVREHSCAVADAAGVIVLGNQEMSVCTGQQVQVLQVASAGLHQLGTAAQENSSSALQVSGLAQQASSVASAGGVAVTQVVQAMQGIHSSSGQIAEIISVIDGIAFQTNLLALNAAVEAARAGEQGRGFAVVAAEVRALAQRSAGAAKEIKGLIDDSVHRIAQGSEQVQQAGRTMEEIMGAIEQVSRLVAQISAASVAQSDGLKQVMQMLAQVDQVSSSNAAIVQTSEQTSDSLRSQAATLVASVATFRLPALLT
ncbi:methyl-accepting chemotaxis protein [Comamonas terrigena]|uniref:methyl-accepting chemotaxis protein n=1 Tax=Comamonas terrigena TaxID=32013 RepID=UPI00244B6DAE|nr:methyl-accepting chemotaxis protein [Comamonas terrigena]MDH1702243.1 methyl-accepting chemotaxis protein [Comamonas terrigena]